MKIKLSLTSLGVKILAIFLTIIFIGLTCIFIAFHTQVPWYAIVFLAFISALGIFSLFLFFNHCIIINTKSDLLMIKTLKIKISEIKLIKINTNYSINPRKYCFIEFILRNGMIYKTSGYANLINFNAVEITQHKVDMLNELLNLNKHSE